MEPVVDAPLLDELLDVHAHALGADRGPYRNHCLRVLSFTLALLGDEGGGDERAGVREKLEIGCAFHDLGIWTDGTFDYLPPSEALAEAHLQATGRAEWIPEVRALIALHHKLRSARAEGRLVEAFRRADLVDVSMGWIRFGLARAFVKAVQTAHPDLGFHRRLVELGVEQIRRDPLRPMPMLRW